MVSAPTKVSRQHRAHEAALGWQEIPLGEVMTLQRGFDLPYRLRSYGSVPIVTSSGIEDYHSTASARGPGVVTGRYGTIGKVFYIEDDYWPLNTTLFVREFNGNDPKFIAHFLKIIDFKSYSGKSGVPGVNRNDLHRIVVQFPNSRIEQTKIADALSSADDLVDSLIGLISKKREIKQGAMQELLDPESGWTESKLGELCNFENGDRGVNYPSKNDLVSFGHPFVNAGHLRDGKIDQNNLDYITTDKLSQLGGGKFRTGDILFCLRGTLGKYALVDDSVPTGAIASSLIIIRPVPSKLSVRFLYYYLQSHHCARMIDLWAGGAAQPNLGGQDLARFSVFLPVSIDNQLEISATLSALDDEIEMLEAKLAKVRQIKQGMMQEFPRHLSQHPGGFVLTQDRLDELVPIEPAAMENRAVIEWDKDDIDVLNFMKVDVLGLGMLGCMRRCFDLLAEHKNLPLTLATIPPEDPATYAMIQKADTVGVFQIESRAQMSMLPRLKPKEFYDLVIEVAIVRPGPIQGDMVHPYLRRREGKEPVNYPKPEFERVLGRTLGVPLFQEQAMRVAIECAGFTPSEADQLRRSMATFKFTGGVSMFREKLIRGMVERGYSAEFAARTFTQLEGFGSYGFPESHAASFALIAYASSWMKCHHPDVFCAALLNAQPMGFYAPAQIVRDAIQHGVEMRPVDINASRWDCTLERSEKGFAVRLGLRMVRGLANSDGATLIASRGEHPFTSIEELWQRCDVQLAALERLAAADAFQQSMRLSRRDALWAIKALRDTQLPLFEAASRREASIVAEIDEAPVALRPMTAGREVVEDYIHVGLSLRAHPLSFLRETLTANRVSPCSAVITARDGSRIAITGIVLVRQRPGSAKGVMFITIEDETGQANLVVWSSIFEKHRRIILSASMIGVKGRVQREGDVIHVVADALIDHTDLLRSVGARDVALPLSRADQVKSGGAPDPRERPPSVSKARDIYVPDLHLGDGIKVPTRDFR